MIPTTGFTSDFLAYASRQTDAPKVFHLTTALSLLSVMMPPELFYWGPGSEVYPILYILAIGNSGVARKTVSMRMGSKLLEVAAPDRLGREVSSYGALLDELKARPQQIMFDEDMARFLKDAKGAGYLSGLKQGYMKVYDAGRLTDASRGRGTVDVDSARFTLYAAANMTELSAHLEADDLSSGFMSRFLVLSGNRTTFMPRSKAKRDPEALGNLVGKLQRIRDLAPRGEVQFAPEATRVMDEWEALLDRQARETSDPKVASLLSRIPDIIRKVSVLFTVDTYVDALPAGINPETARGATLLVTEETATRALSMGAHIHATMFSLLENLHHSMDMRLRAEVLNAFPAAGKMVSLGHLTRASKQLKGSVLRILDTLFEEDAIDKHLTQSGKQLYSRKEGEVSLVAAVIIPEGSTATCPIPAPVIYKDEHLHPPAHDYSAAELYGNPDEEEVGSVVSFSDPDDLYN